MRERENEHRTGETKEGDANFSHEPGTGGDVASAAAAATAGAVAEETRTLGP